MRKQRVKMQKKTIMLLLKMIVRISKNEVTEIVVFYGDMLEVEN